MQVGSLIISMYKLLHINVYNVVVVFIVFNIQKQMLTFMEIEILLITC